MDTKDILNIGDIKAQLLKETLDILQKTKEGVLKGLEYLSAQIPDIIKQFLTWELAIGIICLLIGVCIIIFSIWSWKKLVKITKRSSYFDEDTGMLWVGGNIITTSIGCAFIIANIIKITQLIVAPKIFMIHYILNNLPKK